MSATETVVRLVQLAAAACFVIGLHLMNSPRTARRGNLVSMWGMTAAVVATVVLMAVRGTVYRHRLDGPGRRAPPSAARPDCMPHGR